MACQLLEIEVRLRQEYDEFVKTDDGKKWQDKWKSQNNSDGNFGDYLYDFYPEMLM